MGNRDIQTKRIMGYFIEAAIQIMETEGVDSVTIRKVADAAGYNSATLYNYFDNLDHLILYASVSRLKDYIHELPKYIARSNNSAEAYIAIWDCFCRYAFAQPGTYYRVFFGKLSAATAGIIHEYYAIFPAELEHISAPLMTMLTEGNIFHRNRRILEDCVAEGCLNAGNVDEVNDLTLYFFKGFLSEILERDEPCDAQAEADRAMFYIQRIFFSYYIPPDPAR